MSEQHRPERPPRKNGRPQPGPNGGGAGGGAGGGMRFGRGLFGWVLFIGLAVMLFIVLQTNKKAAQDIPLSEFLALADNGKVAKISIEQEVIRGEFSQPQQVNSNLPPTHLFRTEIPATQI